MKKPIKIAAALMSDILLAAAVIGGDYFYCYRLPHKLEAVNIQTADTNASANGNDADGTSDNLSETVQNQASSVNGTDTDSVNDSDDKTPWQLKFADKFSDTVVSTATEYKSPDISIELSYNSYDSGEIDTKAGFNSDFGSMISYVAADIYISDIKCIKADFAKDSYGTGYYDTLNGIFAESVSNILMINGDSYSNDQNRDNGTVIRNGTVYRLKTPSYETCVLYRDGSMKVFNKFTFDEKKVVSDGAWQEWNFGPSLLDENGKAKTSFDTFTYLTHSHPRTVLGYYEPGHYCFIVVDGRQNGYSRGMYLTELSKLCESLGLKIAYNLDGGHCSSMILNGNTVSRPYQISSDISDAIAITENQ